MPVFSFAFFGFFAAVFALYWLAPHRWRTALLFAASAGFYALFGLPYTLLLLACMAGCWAGGLWLGRGRSHLRLALCVALALAPLLLFKYLDFLAGGLAALSRLLGAPFQAPYLKWVQPVGVSYYTFQMISYLVDVYRQKLAPEKNFFACSVSLSLFLQITSGPLTRPRDLLPQLRQERAFDTARGIASAQLVLLGLFKKIVVADALAYYTKAVYADPTRLYGLSLMVAALFYTVQIYADFSGYSDMMRGFGGLLGLELAENFDAPYLSRSVKEFWKRWHISLSGWLMEYVYIPLGGNRVSRPRYYFNLFFTFVLSGLWHGASAPMLVWGALHGAYRVAGAATDGLRLRAYRALRLRRDGLPARLWQTLVTFVLVGFAWIFFGAPNLATAWYIVSHLFTGFVPTIAHLKESLVLLGLSAEACVRFAVLFVALFAVDLAARDRGWRAWLSARRPWVQAAVCYLLVAALVFWGNLGGGNSMYFKF